MKKKKKNISKTKRKHLVLSLLGGIFVIVILITTFLLSQRTKKQELSAPKESKASVAQDIKAECDSGTYQEKRFTCDEVDPDPDKPQSFANATLAACYKMNGNIMTVHWDLQYNHADVYKYQSGERAMEGIFDKWVTEAWEAEPGKERGWPRETSWGIVTDFNGDGIIQTKYFNDPVHPGNPNFELLQGLFKQGNLNIPGFCNNFVLGGNCNYRGEPHCYAGIRDCHFNSLGACTCDSGGQSGYVHSFDIDLNTYTNGIKPVYVFYEVKIVDGELCNTTKRDGCTDPAPEPQKGEEYNAYIELHPPGLAPMQEVTLAPTPGVNCTCDGSSIAMTTQTGNLVLGDKGKFLISGTDPGREFASDTWSGGVNCSGSVELGGGSVWHGLKECNTTALGNFTWTHSWKNRSDCGTCTKQMTYCIIAPTATPALQATNTPAPPAYTPTPTSGLVVTVTQITLTPTSTISPTRAPSITPTPSGSLRVNISNGARPMLFLKCTSADNCDQLQYITTSSYTFYTRPHTGGSAEQGIRVQAGALNEQFIVDSSSPGMHLPYNDYNFYYYFMWDYWSTGAKYVNLTAVTTTPAITSTPTPALPESCKIFDIADPVGIIDINDFMIFASQYQPFYSQPDASGDFNGDDYVDMTDFILFSYAYSQYHETGTCE